MSLDLNKLKNKLDEALSNETNETLTKFLTNKRMSNNKQSMKLYTEEQVRQMLSKARGDIWYSYNDLFANQTPIELPSDDEVEQYLKSFPYTKHLDDGQFNDGVIYGATIGIDWMRDKIQGGNNEQ